MYVLQLLFMRPPLLMYYKLSISMFVLTPSLAQRMKLLLKSSISSVHMLNALLLLIPLSLYIIFSKPIVLFKISSNYNNDFHTLTLSTIHVNGFLKKRVLLETPTLKFFFYRHAFY